MKDSKDLERSSSFAATGRGLYRSLLTGCALALLVAGSACAQNDGAQRANHTAAGESANATRTVTGAATPFGKGSVRSWGTPGKDGKPTAIGVAFTAGATGGPGRDGVHSLAAARGGADGLQPYRHQLESEGTSAGTNLRHGPFRFPLLHDQPRGA